MRRGTIIALVTAGIVCMASGAGAQDRAYTEAQRREWNREYDKKGLLGTTVLVTDTSDSFVTIPADMDMDWLGDVDVAETAPVIDFIPISGMEPAYFPEDELGYWANFGDVVQAPNGRYYFAAGDHRGRYGNSYVFEYDPIVNRYRQIIDCGRLCGWKQRGVGDGKIHGEMGAMPDGSLWILTYWDPMPWSTEEDYDRWPGSNLIRYDTYTGVATDMGIPLPKAGWPYYTMDRQRGNLCAVGFRGEVLNYDVNEERATWAGFPPPDVTWWVRCTMLDPDTGMFWSCTQEKPYNLVSFDPATNTFTRHELTCPEDIGRNAGNNSRIRAHSERRTREGFIWCVSENGTLYKLWPDEPRIETVMQLWADYTYSPRISLSSDDRYIYYVANTKRSPYRYRPIVQLDTKTLRRKVLAFPADHYFDTYGYSFVSLHGSTLSEDDGTFVMVFNGKFMPRDVDGQDHPALFVLHIPESER